MNRDDFKRMNNLAVQLQHEAICEIRNRVMQEFPAATGDQVFGAYTMAPLYAAIELVIMARHGNFTEQQTHQATQVVYHEVCDHLDRFMENAAQVVLSQN